MVDLIHKCDAYLAPAGRIIMGAFFVLAGLGKVMDFSGTASYIEIMGLPMPTVLAFIAIVIEVGIGGALLIGYKPRLAALLLAGFVFIISFPFHGPNMWSDQMQQIMFMKNMAIVGALIFMAAHAGSFANWKPKQDDQATATPTPTL